MLSKLMNGIEKPKPNDSVVFKARQATPEYVLHFLSEGRVGNGEAEAHAALHNGDRHLITKPRAVLL